MNWAEERAKCLRLAREYAAWPAYARCWQEGYFWALLLPLLAAVGIKRKPPAPEPGQITIEEG